VKNIKNEDIIAKLITLKGVGRWTAEMFLIFHLGRLDIMPSTDLAIRNQYKKLKSLKEDISPQQLTLATKPLSPFRSIAAWYLWQSTSNAS
jgi:DNA-3-methyladenine glycosylase II